MKYFKIIPLLVAAAFLSGCAHFKHKSGFKYISWQERKEELRRNENWNIIGVFSVTYNKKRDYASFEWQQDHDKYEINIFGPMNLNRIKIHGNVNQVELCQTGSKCIRDKSPEKLFFSQFGWRLPISNMRYWVLALPALTKIDAANFDQYGHLTALKQQGWKIYYSEFRSIKSVDLPYLIELQNKNILIKLKIKNYSFIIP